MLPDGTIKKEIIRVGPRQEFDEEIYFDDFLAEEGPFGPNDFSHNQGPYMPRPDQFRPQDPYFRKNFYRGQSTRPESGWTSSSGSIDGSDGKLDPDFVNFARKSDGRPFDRDFSQTKLPKNNMRFQPKEPKIKVNRPQKPSGSRPV